MCSNHILGEAPHSASSRSRWIQRRTYGNQPPRPPVHAERATVLRGARDELVEGCARTRPTKLGERSVRTVHSLVHRVMRTLLDEKFAPIPSSLGFLELSLDEPARPPRPSTTPP